MTDLGEGPRQPHPTYYPFLETGPPLISGSGWKLNGCRQRLLFTQQLTQQKCSLCSQRTVIKGPIQKLLWSHVNVAFKFVGQVLGVSSEYIKPLYLRQISNHFTITFIVLSLLAAFCSSIVDPSTIASWSASPWHTKNGHSILGKLCFTFSMASYMDIAHLAFKPPFHPKGSILNVATFQKQKWKEEVT